MFENYPSEDLSFDNLNPAEAAAKFGRDFADSNFSIELETDVLRTNILEEWKDGNHLSLFVPAETQTKLFLPDTASFRSDQEDLHNDLNEPLWATILQKFGLDLNESDSYGVSLSEARDLSLNNSYSMSSYDLVKNSLDILTASVNAEDTSEAVYNEIVAGFIIENASRLDEDEKQWLRDWRSGGSENQDFTTHPTPGPWYFTGTILSDGSEYYDLSQAKKLLWAVSKDSREYFDVLIDAEIKRIKDTTGVDYVPRDRIEEDIKRAFNVTIYERFFQNGFVQNLMEAVKDRSGSQRFNEWEVPMLRVDLDPDAVIIRGFSLTMANNFAKMQVQMQDEPTYQFIGGRDTVINMSMTVSGEAELIKLKRVFDHVSGLARLEHATGVIGFLGIKNVITALSGVKYVIPMNYQVTTIPNYPHMYNVNLTLVDFDVFQQKREELSNKHQKQMVEEFMTKKNPFLRIKQMWGSFNTYPDFPLYIKDEEGEIVGNLDPDFYFRSFDMYDNDVIYNFTQEEPNIFSHDFNGDATDGWHNMRLYDHIDNAVDEALSEGGNVNTVARRIIDNISPTKVSREYVQRVIRAKFSPSSQGPPNSSEYGETLLSSLFEIDAQSVEGNIFMEDIGAAPHIVGDYSASSEEQLRMVEAALEGEYSLTSDIDQEFEDEYRESNPNAPIRQKVSFHPDEVEFHHIITLLSAVEQDEVDKGRIPAMMQSAAGIHFGYTDRYNGRFYFNDVYNEIDVQSGESVEQAIARLKPAYATDEQTPQHAFSDQDGSASGIPGVSAVQKYQNAYDGSEHAHWEKMMVDAKYRDVSGRMLRAFPTYMLWLIDEGGYFAGVKLFDNFYGLQSIIDFSVVSSEDLLGDTLIFRVSNLYSKLTTPESNKIFNPNVGDGEDSLSLNQGLAGIVDLILNRSRNILAHMRHEYIVDVNNIRLKPGVRVHLRAGYGANPNSLQTIFNGVVTNVEQGEIVTITAQSDAIELGAVVNSTNKNGDSGKIDGGIDTGMYLSEPRDLMIRLLSMGASRTREAIAHATKGVIFSENKFGIRHFGNMIYEPINNSDKAKHDAIRSAMGDALVAVGNADLNPLNLAADAAATAGTLGLAVNPTTSAVGVPLAARGFANSMRGGALNAVGQMISNLNSQIDFEIYKRNIYPGNGTGVAQFLGGDLDTGWTSTASITPGDSFNERAQRDLGHITDVSWNKLLESYEKGDLTAANSLNALTSGNEIYEQDSTGVKVGAAITGGAILGAGVAALPFVGMTAGAAAVYGGSGAGFLGVLSGKHGENFFRTIGILSPNADNDLPGFDEVSFRAQTYMRSVWDIFQTCARLLPNYIVAVRPFEDRSTVFYGKPHWLYTSGVVPVTTGFPGEDRAGLGPKVREPDLDFINLMDKINAETNPLADYAAYFSSNETSEAFKDLAQKERNSDGIFLPTKDLRGKVINFLDESSLNAYVSGRSRNGTPVRVAALPLARPRLTAGPHLPIDPNGEALAVPFGLMQQGDEAHQQIPNLIPRYGIGIFSDFSLNTYRDRGYNFVSGGAFFGNNLTNSPNPLQEVIDIEDQFLGQNKNNPGDDDFVARQSLVASSGVFDLDVPLMLDSVNAAVVNQGVAITSGDVEITMPLPSQQELASVFDPTPHSELLAELHDQTGLFEYTENESGSNAAIYDEWKAPTTALDEQFYIAMRWPYEPNVDEESKELFKSQYGIDEFVGTADDYKKRKVLVYSPASGRAVVCRPAYFFWGGQDPRFDFQAVDGAVSPDAAYYLGIITGPGNGSGFRDSPEIMPCYTAFVPDSVPVGVISDDIAPANSFTLVGDPANPLSGSVSDYQSEYSSVNFNANRFYDAGTLQDHIIGFGAFTVREGEGLRVVANEPQNRMEALRSGYDSTSAYTLDAGVSTLDPTRGLLYGGNAYLPGASGPRNYLDAVVQGQYELVTEDALVDILEDEIGDNNQTKANGGTGRVSFASVYNMSDSISFDARRFYDENFSDEVSVIAGNGRTLYEAQEIWDQFRYQYHELEEVKEIFANMYGFDPDSEQPFPDFFQSLLEGEEASFLNPFSATGDSALDEFSLILGSDFVDKLEDPAVAAIPVNPAAPSQYRDQRMIDAIEFARENYIDADLDEGGLVESINSFLGERLKKIREKFIVDSTVTSSVISSLTDEQDPVGSPRVVDLGSEITTPKQLFLLMVGAFRQAMWEDPYARAWVVLKPDKRVGFMGLGAREHRWSLKPINIIFRAYIDPYNDYAVDKQKFLSLLTSTRGEGNSSGNGLGFLVESTGNFFSDNIAPIYNAISDSLDGLLATFRLSTQQMGYALQEASAFRRHANVMNKVFNDSIYYSLGREGSLLRGVDNPFTREYGEPVLEVREPFQKLHYLSSFSHILNNQIQENLNNVATVVTGVSDGKYPVTVALDKGAPAERQVEKTIETGIYFDNAIGTGVLGIIHPIMHPFETFRGLSKAAQGTPDELTARRVALAHLKESIKDIYQGEIIIIGNPDIRPHDLVYLSDVYERMYGIFEVEQVVHNFTPELGFTTSITPNALVTVNDPARWFLSSWIHSWFSKQAIRNDARVILDRAKAGSSGISLSGQVSMDRLAQVLEPQIVGSLQFTHGSSALVRDAVAMKTAQSLSGDRDGMIELLQSNSAEGGLSAALTATAAGLTVGTISALAAPFTAGTSLAVGAAVSSTITQLTWKGWSWVRDNLLDQHGCYVQYLSKNGQPMDAGLSYNQGMVVGKHHSKAMLPGVLGVRRKTRTVDGHAYVRTDDLFKSMGWKETEINNFVRYVSYENALVHARVMKLSGMSPDKASLSNVFKVIARLVEVKGGDLVVVEDILSGEQFTVRLDGIEAEVVNAIGVRVDSSLSSVEQQLVISDPTMTSSRSAVFAAESLQNKIFVIRINEKLFSPDSSAVSVLESDYEAGATVNTVRNYEKEEIDSSNVLGTLFYHLPDDWVYSAISTISDLLRPAAIDTTSVMFDGQITLTEDQASGIADQLGIDVDEVYGLNWLNLPGAPAPLASTSDFVSVFKATLDSDSVFYNKFIQIYDAIDQYNSYYDFYELGQFTSSDSLYGLSEEDKKKFSNIVGIYLLNKLYTTTNEWPRVSWDEYHEDGKPYTLNWEMVTRNLAKPKVDELLVAKPSVIDVNESSITGSYVGDVGGY